MEQYNTLINERLDAKDMDINISSVTDRNWLSIEELISEFDDEFHKGVSDDDAPHDDDDDQPKEEPTHTPKTFDSYIDKETGLLRGMYG